MTVADTAYAIRQATLRDLPGILVVQHQAFGRIATEYSLDPDRLPPLRETLSDLQSLLDEGMTFFVAATEEGEIVGSVRAAAHDGTVEIGRLVVADGWLRRGIATVLMRRLEASFPRAELFTLFTGEEAGAARTLYGGLGYELARRQDMGPYVLVWLEKRGPAARQ